MESLVKPFSDLFKETYDTQRNKWENSLKHELKLEDIGGKNFKKHLDLGQWPTLSLESLHQQQLSCKSAWKKASQTYINPDFSHLKEFLIDDLQSGVRCFFFHKDFLEQSDWKLIQDILENFADKKDLEVFLLGQKKFKFQTTLNVIDEEQILLARTIHEKGGHNVHELALLTCQLIDSIEKPIKVAGVFLDSHFFKNIAKVRALKLLIQKVMHETGLEKEIKILTLNSYREWTLFERYTNMLRNNVQVAAGYIAGADFIQSSGYQSIFDLETNVQDAFHTDRSNRMARNTGHILSLESMLGIVEDAAYGSFHLENLSHQYAESAWKLMQLLLKMNHAERIQYLEVDLQKIRNERTQRVNFRKDIMAGMNDFPDGKEKLNLTLKEYAPYRVARSFEALRLRVEKLKHFPPVQIFCLGEFAELNNRINFIKNYFELIGLEVLDPLQTHKNPSERVIVLCAKDEHYPELIEKVSAEKAFIKFIAGKVEFSGYEAIFAGQNVYEVLNNLVKQLEDLK